MEGKPLDLLRSAQPFMRNFSLVSDAQDDDLVLLDLISMVVLVILTAATKLLLMMMMMLLLMMMLMEPIGVSIWLRLRFNESRSHALERVAAQAEGVGGPLHPPLHQLLRRDAGALAAPTLPSHHSPTLCVSALLVLFSLASSG
eukprot:2590901-Rhodomonas_salina.1